jgi:methyl-accepting chemotaxis protein
MLKKIKNNEIFSFNDILITRTNLSYDSEKLGSAYIAYKTDFMVTAINEILKNSIIIIIIMILINIIVNIFFIKKIISKPISQFENGLLNFFNYLNKETDVVELLNDKINDEIGTMAKVVNKNILKVQKGIDEDTQMINEAKDVMSIVKKGDYHSNIEKSTSNKALNEFKNEVNDMINATKKGIVLLIKNLHKRRDAEAVWSLINLDTALTVYWKKPLLVPFGYTLLGWDHTGEQVQLLFSRKQYENELLSVFKINLNTGAFKEQKIST